VSSFAVQLELIATGCAVVVSALAALWAATALIGSVFKRIEANGEPPEEVMAEAELMRAASMETEDSVPPHHLAVIAAAVASTLGKQHRIIAIKAPAHVAPGWARATLWERTERR